MLVVRLERDVALSDTKDDHHETEDERTKRHVDAQREHDIAYEYEIDR